MPGVVAFLSDEWVAALDAAAASSAGLAQALAGVHLVVEQGVTGPGPDDVVTYHVTVDDGRVSVRPGPATAPTVRFRQDRATAAAIASGETSAQRAFMTGRLRVGGDLSVLANHGEALSELGDVFASVRAETEPEAADA